MIAFVVLAALLVVVLGAVAVGAVAVKNNVRNRQRLLPGSSAGVPLSWAGAHSPEAKLHRRLTAAISGVREVASGEPTVAENLVVLEHEALRVEQQLLAASNVAARLRDDALEAIEPAVAQIEEVAAELIGRTTLVEGTHVQSALRELSERLDLLDQARAELDDPSPGTN